MARLTKNEKRAAEMLAGLARYESVKPNIPLLIDCFEAYFRGCRPILDRMGNRRFDPHAFRLAIDDLSREVE